VRPTAALLDDEFGDGRQVLSDVIGHPVVPVVAVARRQAMAAHLGDPHIEAAACQVGTQADAARRIPEAPVGETAVQQDHRFAGKCTWSGVTETGQGQFDTAVARPAGLQQVNVLAQVAADLGAVQDHGKQTAAALHGAVLH
jgi:hypothetical protein